MLNLFNRKTIRFLTAGVAVSAMLTSGSAAAASMMIDAAPRAQTSGVQMQQKSPSATSGQDGVLYQGLDFSSPLRIAPALTPAPAASQSAPYVPVTSPNLIEAGVNYHAVSDDQGNWFGQFIAAQYQSDPWNRWYLQLQQQQAFKDQGSNITIGNNHVFNEDWSSFVSAGVSTDASFLSKYRADASLSRKWLEGRNFVTTGGITLSKAEAVYTEKSLFFDVVYYTSTPWILQAGVRYGLSDPGSVASYSGYGAVTYGYNKNYFITLKAGGAHEAYQLLGNGNSIVNAFDSLNASLNYRKWIEDNWGFNIGTEFYRNPVYNRLGGTASLFYEF
jgi:YaiO family outer membrane protein